MTQQSRSSLQGMLLVLPVFIVVFVILFLPTVNTIYMSFTDYSLTGSGSNSWIGLENYKDIFQSGEFIQSLINTLVFTGVTVFLELAFGMLLALLLNKLIVMKNILRTTILFPWALPTALNAIVWRWLFNTDFGFFNNLLYGLGITSEKINWLGDIPLAMESMMIVAIWKTSSFMALILLTGLQTIPDELYEAASIDGAGTFFRFRTITLPLIVPSILLSLLFRSMDAFRAFELPFALTQGGPAGSTQTLSLFGYRQFFQFLKFDTGAAVSVVQFIFIFIIGLIYLRSFKMEV
ncbi:MAG: carbohydrate ABC transporter permease [Spirochaetota bacterium]